MVNSKKIKTETITINGKMKQKIIHYNNKKFIKKVMNYNEENEELVSQEVHTQKLDSSDKLKSTKVEIRDANKELLSYKKNNFNEFGNITLVETYSKEYGIQKTYNNYIYEEDKIIKLENKMGKYYEKETIYTKKAIKSLKECDLYETIIYRDNLGEIYFKKEIKKYIEGGKLVEYLIKYSMKKNILLPFHKEVYYKDPIIKDDKGNNLELKNIIIDKRGEVVEENKTDYNEINKEIRYISMVKKGRKEYNYTSEKKYDKEGRVIYECNIDDFLNRKEIIQKEYIEINGIYFEKGIWNTYLLDTNFFINSGKFVRKIKKMEEFEEINDVSTTKNTDSIKQNTILKDIDNKIKKEININFNESGCFYNRNIINIVNYNKDESISEEIEVDLNENIIKKISYTYYK